MHSSRWPTQNKVSCVFGGSLFHYVVSGHYFYFLFILYRSFAYVLWILVLCFDEISVCVNIIVCVYCGFSLAFFLVSSYSSLFVFILSSLNLCYMYYSFNALYVLLLQCFLMIDRKEYRSNWERKGRKTERTWGKENCNQNMLEEKNLFSINKNVLVDFSLSVLFMTP